MTLHLTQQQEDLVFGTLLGDGNLSTGSKGRTWRMRALQKKEHKPYIEHKYSIVKNMCGAGLIFGSAQDTRTGKVAERYYFNTRVQACFKPFADSFYTWNPVSNKFEKDVPAQVESFLTPRAVAYWYQDDGALKWLGKSNAMRICTESFSEAGVKRLQAALQNRYGIKTNLSKKTNKGVFVGYRIEVPEKSSAAFADLIKPYLIDCMKYKVSDGKRGALGPKT